MNLERLKKHSDPSEPMTVPRTSRANSVEGDRVLFKKDSIFCNGEGRKQLKSKGAWTTEGLSQFEFEGWKNVLDTAENKLDETLLIRIRGNDLFACEAKYHPSCRMKYIQRPEKWRSTDDVEQRKQADMEEAHREAFKKVSQIIDRDIIEEKKILNLTDLRETYISSLQDSKCPNPDYRSENLTRKLQKHDVYKEKLSFCNMGSFKSYIVYSSDIDTGTAVKQAYTLGSTDMIKAAGTHLHQLILDGFKNSTELQWPPTAQYLGSLENAIPAELMTFLSYVLAGKPYTSTIKAHRLVYSIGQDICRAATHGEWKLPKHILICMTLRHLFRSERLITLLNRMGHSENYSFSLELETAIAQAVEESSSLLTTLIVRSPEAPAVFHSEFDNFDQLLNDLTGMGSIHTAHGIMMQEIEGDPTEHGGTRPEIPSITRSKQRSLKLDKVDILPECYVTKRSSPDFVINQVTCPGADEALQSAKRCHLTWVLIRMQSHTTQQEVPGWTGFVSMIGTKPINLTTIDYYPVIAK